MIYRRFGFLRQRMLLYYQDILRETEEKLDALDREDFNSEDWPRATGWRQGDDERDPSRRKELLEKLRKQLEIYGKSSPGSTRITTNL